MRLRILAFGLLCLATTVAALVVRARGGPDGGPDGGPWGMALAILGGAWAAAVVLDVVIHACRGQGQACRVCGHARPMRSFRMEGPCPRCGE